MHLISNLKNQKWLIILVRLLVYKSTWYKPNHIYLIRAMIDWEEVDNKRENFKNLKTKMKGNKWFWFNNKNYKLKKKRINYLNNVNLYWIELNWIECTTGQVVEYHRATVETRVRFPGRYILINGLPCFVPGWVTIRPWLDIDRLTLII